MVTQTIEQRATRIVVHPRSSQRRQDISRNLSSRRVQHFVLAHVLAVTTLESAEY